MFWTRWPLPPPLSCVVRRRKGARGQDHVARDEPLFMATRNRPPRRRRILVGFGLFGLGVGLTVLVYTFFLAAPPPSLAQFRTAGKLPTGDPPDPHSGERDADARRLAGQVIDGVVKKDAAAVAALCDTPFLGGAPHNLRSVRDRSALENCLRDDLCQGPYGEYMFDPAREINTVLSPQAFFERYADDFVAMQDTKKLLDALSLGPTDRLVVEDRRGLLVAVRTTAGGPRVAGIVPTGFQPPRFNSIRDVIYGRKFGTALTLDVIQPKTKSNRAAVLYLVSDSFASRPAIIGSSMPIRTAGLLEAGYTVIFVPHSSAPSIRCPRSSPTVSGPFDSSDPMRPDLASTPTASPSWAVAPAGIWR